MSGKKITDVQNRIEYFSLRCKEDKKILDRSFSVITAKVDTTRTPTVDMALIDKMFDDAGTDLIRERNSLIENAHKSVATYTKLTELVASTENEPGRILKKLKALDKEIRIKGEAHYMDDEYRRAEALGNELDHWVNQCREMLDKRAQIDYELKNTKKLKQSLSRIDSQLLELESKAKSRLRQESELRRLSEYRLECKSILAEIDLNFLKNYDSGNLALIEKIAQQMELAAHSDDLKPIVSKLYNVSSVCSREKQAMLELQARLRDGLDSIKLRLASINMVDPVHHTEIGTDAFYAKYGEERLLTKADISDELLQVQAQVDNMELDQAGGPLSSLESRIVFFEAGCRDDQLKCGELVATAQALRTQLLDSGTVGPKNINVSIEQMLSRGIKIETLIPEGAYLHVLADGGIESDIDVLSADCTKTMSDINDMLVSRGFTPIPRNYTLPKNKQKKTLDEVKKQSKIQRS